MLHLLKWSLAIEQPTHKSTRLVQVRTESQEHQAIVTRFVKAKLSGVLNEAHVGTAKYTLRQPDLTVANAFRTMENAKADLGITEYGLSQPSLEQVFMTVVGDRSDLM